MQPNKKDVLSFLVIFLLYTNGIFFEYGFYIKPFQLFVPFLFIIYFARYSVSINRHGFHLQGHDIVFIFFILLAVLSTMYATVINPISSIRLTLNLLILFSYYLIAKNLLSNKSPEVIIYVVLQSSLIYASLSLIAYVEARYNLLGLSDVIKSRSLGFVLSGYRKIRMSGLEIDPNFFVLYLTPGLFFSLLSILNRQSMINKKLSYSVFFLTLLGLILSLSRAGILINMGFIFMTLMIVFKRIKFQHSIIISTMIIAVLGIFQEDIWSRLQLLETEFETRGMGRYSLLLFGIDLFKSDPFLGLGFNQFAEYFATRFGEIRYSHNTYLSVLVELGLFGLMLFGAFLIIIIKNLYFTAKAVKEDMKWIYQSSILIILSQCAQISSLYAISSSALWLTFIISSVIIQKQSNEL